MAWELASEVVNYVCRLKVNVDLPQEERDITGSEISILLALAERAGSTGKYARQAWDSETWKLIWFSGANDQSGFRKILRRLAARGLEIRVQRGTDRRGLPVYATKGSQVTYLLPDLGEKGGTCVPPSGPVVPPSGPVVPPSGPVVPPSGPVVPPSGPVVPPSPSLPSSPPNTSSPRVLRPEPGPPADEEQSATERLIAEHRQYARIPSAMVPKLAGVVSQLLRDGYTGDHLRTGLQMLHERGGRPGLLPYLVQELVAPPRAPQQRREATTDQRVREALEVAEALGQAERDGTALPDIFQMALESSRHAAPTL